jgi:signal transduction histidine kinase
MTAQTRSPFWKIFAQNLAGQAAASLLNSGYHRLLSGRDGLQTLSIFRPTKEIEVSLMVQNLPAHYDNPEFRDDMLRVISSSVMKMNAMCSRLSLMTQKIDLRLVDVDLHALVATTLAEIKDSLKASLLQELRPIPRLLIDPEQLQKVLLNLILNANEAVDEQGEIRVQTDWQEAKPCHSIRQWLHVSPVY